MHTANSPAKGKSPRRSRSMKTVTERQRIGDESARFHRWQTCATLARSPWPRWLNICVSISSGSWSHISQFQLGPSSSLRSWGSCCNLVRFSCHAPRYRLDRLWKSHCQLSGIQEILIGLNSRWIEVDRQWKLYDQLSKIFDILKLELKAVKDCKDRKKKKKKKEENYEQFI